MADTYVPLIGSSVKGPLGALHLPRLWLKVSLEAAGKLAPGFPGIGKGFDGMTLLALGLNEAAVRKFITESKPSYPDFERWVKAQPGATVTTADIIRHNNAIRGYVHDEATRKAILAAAGIPDDGSTSPTAMHLNLLDDCDEIWRAELGGKAPAGADSTPLATTPAAPTEPAPEAKRDEAGENAAATGAAAS